MPTNREPLTRQRRVPFTREAIALFLELEHSPRGARRSEEFKVKEQRLHQLLGIDPSWITGVSILDRSAGPCWPPGYCSYELWFEVRAVRKALLAAIGPAGRPA
jgi:hypothetical protein